MAQKHLKELLQEDQEPFYLKDYIADKKCLLKKQAPKTTTQQIQLKKPKPPISKNTSIFSKNACFFSIQDSPDLRKSPLFDFSASPMSKKSPNRVLLHVPAKTASLLLEAAIRIQQKSSKPKPNVKQSSFGLFGSMLKRLTLRNRTHKLKNSHIDDNAVFATNGLVANSNSNNNSNMATSVSCSSSSCYNGRSSSLDLESCSSGRSFDANDDDNDDEFEFVNVLKENNNNNNININDNNEDFGSLCLSPFRFAHSPARHIIEEKKSYEKESRVESELEEEDEEDKEQNSPVSVLDPPFEDDYDGHDEDYYDDHQQCSYALVQRAKQRLLHKLHRFEQLAELDPIELEKRMSDADEKYDNEEGVVLEQAPEMDEYDSEAFTFANKIQHSPDYYEDIVNKPGIKRLISDMIIEEENVENVIDNNDQMIIKRVCNRLESWKQVECNTIDMMVEMDLKADMGNWKTRQTEISETSIDIEGAIFAVLVKELVSELASSADC